MNNEFSISIERAEMCSQILSKSRIKANLSRRDMSHIIGGIRKHDKSMGERKRCADVDLNARMVRRDRV